jgi:hypothetical protein
VATRFNSTTGGNWNSTSSWATTNGGAGPASSPVAGDTVNITGSGANITVNVSSACGDLTITGATLAGSAALACNGNVSLGGTITYSGTLTLNATATGKTFASNGKTFPGNITLNGVGGGWTQSDALLCSGTFTETNGAFSDGGFTLTASIFSSNNSNTRTITKTAQWTITGTGTCVNFATVTGLTWSGSGGWNLTDSSATARIFASGGLTFGGTAKVSAGSGNFTLSGTPTVGGLDFTGYTGAWQNGALTSTGDIKLGSGMTVASTGTITMAPDTGVTATFTSNGVSISRPVTVNGAGTVQQADAFTSSAALTLTAGTWRTQNFSLTATDIRSGAANVRGFFPGSSTITLTGFNASNNSVLDFGTGVNLSFDAGTSTIKVTDSSSSTKSFGPGGQTFNTIWYAPGTGTGTLSFSGTTNLVVATLKDDGSAAHSITFVATNSYSIGTWQVSGNSGALITLASSTPGTQYMLTKTGGGNVAADYLSISDMVGGPGYSWFMGAHSVNGGNNRGVAFCTAANASMMELAA